MVNNSVVIKGSKHGIVVVLDDSVSFDELKEAVRDKFSGASKFFDKANMAISFEGRSLNDEQQRQLLDIISEVSDINIVCVIDNDELKDAYFKRAVEAKLDDMAASTGQFYKGTLRSGQILETE